MKRLFSSILWAFLALGVSYAYAQSPVVTKPFGVNGFNSSTNIISTNIYQQIWPASTATTGRTDCIIQNNGSSSMFVFFGAPASATTPNSLTLAAGSIFRCNNGGVIIRDQISITGTISQNFFALQE